MSPAASTSVIGPAYNEGPAIGQHVDQLRAGAQWREILVIDDGSTDRTADDAEAQGARVVSHPYKTGNGAAVKSGLRQASGAFVYIIDSDGQHRPADAVRLVPHLDIDDLVATQSHGTNSSVLVITLSVVIFLIGLVPEQISTLRFGGHFDGPSQFEEPRV